MNSKQLSQRHFHTYESFFLSNNVVLSTPFVMNWAGDVLDNYSGVSIKQQIPLRVYMGYSYTNTGKITLGKIYHLDMTEDTFLESNMLEYAPYMGDVSAYLNEKYADLIKSCGGIDIQLLSELPRGAGLGFGSLIALLLAAVGKKIKGNLEEDTLQSMKIGNINEQLADQYSNFFALLTDALEIDKRMYGMISSGAKIASFFESQYPLVSFSEDYDKTSKEVNVKTKRYFGFRLNDVYPNLRPIPYMPLDYGIVYSGKPVLLEQIAGKNYKNNTMLHGQIKEEMQNCFGEFLENMLPNKRPRFFKYLIQPEEDEFNSTNGKILGVMSMKILYFMARVYSNGYDENAVLNFLDSIKKMRQADCVTRGSSQVFLKFLTDVFYGFEGALENLSLLPNESTIMGGSVIGVLPLEGCRKEFTDTIEKASKTFVGSKVVYINWVDGLGYEGMRIEQDIRGGKYSDFLQGKRTVIKRMDGKVVLGDSTTIASHIEKGIALDMINNKLYINGQKLTSQEIHSQSATIEILKKLIEHPGKDISNKDLPISSYSKGKNEMLGKIVIPLLEIVEKKIGKKLPLICKGSMYEFYLKLNPTDIDIVVIENVKGK